jgi:hypothetical protein
MTPGEHLEGRAVEEVPHGLTDGQRYVKKELYGNINTTFYFLCK